MVAAWLESAVYTKQGNLDLFIFKVCYNIFSYFFRQLFQKHVTFLFSAIVLSGVWPLTDDLGLPAGRTVKSWRRSALWLLVTRAMAAQGDFPPRTRLLRQCDSSHQCLVRVLPSGSWASLSTLNRRSRIGLQQNVILSHTSNQADAQVNMSHLNEVQQSKHCPMHFCWLVSSSTPVSFSLAHMVHLRYLLQYEAEVRRCTWINFWGPFHTYH